jgi:hypothetical protein
LKTNLIIKATKVTYIRSLYQWWRAIINWDPGRTLQAIFAIPGYIRDYRLYRRLDRKSGPALKLNYPCLLDKNSDAGTTKGHYFQQDLYVAQKIAESDVKMHADIGSRIDGFVAHVASFREIHVYDIRPAEAKIKNITFIRANLMSDNFKSSIKYDSVSCLHALEHFGLGRYGDPINPDGWKIGLKNIVTMLDKTKSSRLYLSVPTGRARVEFNAHRIFEPDQILQESHKNGLVLTSLSCINDDGVLKEIKLSNPQDVYDLKKMEFACGIYSFILDQAKS